jgi:hypothetical protein
MLAIEKASAAAVFKERNRYPFINMEVGDSLLIIDAAKAESARVAAYQFVKRNGLSWKFAVRKTRDGWRIFRFI